MISDVINNEKEIKHKMNNITIKWRNPGASRDNADHRQDSKQKNSSELHCVRFDCILASTISTSGLGNILSFIFILI